jgi:hypothetical protein
MRKLGIARRGFRGRHFAHDTAERAAIEPLDAAMSAHIRRVLTATAGRVEGPHGAARLLDINPHTLRARMRKLGLVPSQFRRRRSPTPADLHSGGNGQAEA